MTGRCANRTNVKNIDEWQTRNFFYMLLKSFSPSTRREGPLSSQLYPTKPNPGLQTLIQEA